MSNTLSNIYPSTELDKHKHKWTAYTLSY
ncbi:hypothetical protein MPL3365_30199 [Mesorhizobium plurifarium]|uniref:Uncharacterized protein n=1 Tax=Mesorhizobium plurifarium TaxID=69974 RepID=A0A090G779_MESPL|nr:hypothetical protein MPL3365_30199 [Mesorhizobium plurifarium]